MQYGPTPTSSGHTVCVLLTNIKGTKILKFYIHVAGKTLSTLLKKKREIQNNQGAPSLWGVTTTYLTEHSHISTDKRKHFSYKRNIFSCKRKNFRIQYFRGNIHVWPFSIRSFPNWWVRKVACYLWPGLYRGNRPGGWPALTASDLQTCKKCSFVFSKWKSGKLSDFSTL